MTAMEELGVPVQAVSGVSLLAGKDGHGQPCLYAVMGEGAGPLFVLQIDPRTGAFRQFSAPHGVTGGRPTLWSERWGRLFIGGSGGKDGIGRLQQFNPQSECVEDLGAVNVEGGCFPVSIDEAPDGSIYIGLFNACGLLRYLPDQRRYVSYGRLDRQDQYLYVLCGADGTVAALVKMSRPHVVALDPRTGEHTPLGPVADTNAQTGFVNLLKRGDGRLYIDSHEGRFRIQGSTLVRIDELPPPPPAPTLPDGSTFRFLNDLPAHRLQHRDLAVTAPNAQEKVFHLDWQYEGTEIYLVRPGVEGKVYGSSVLPLHFFVHDPGTRQSVDYGACCTSGGEIYSMDWLDGKLYFCAYTHAILGVYDPKRPWRFGQGRYVDSPPLRYGSPEDNPRQLGRMDTVAYRPRDMLAGPAGKVWVASVPDYGMWGGTLAWYDPAGDAFGSHRNIYPDCSPYALAFVPEKGLLAVGFSIYGGSGTEPRAGRTGLVLWDPQTDREVWRGDCGIEIVGVMDLEYAGSGLVYAIVHPRPPEVLHALLLLLDLPAGRIVKQTRLDAAAGWPLEVSFQRDDRCLYGATRQSVYRVPLGTVDVEVLWRDEQHGPTAGGALLDGYYYFASRHKLRRLRVNR